MAHPEATATLSAGQHEASAPAPVQSSPSPHLEDTRPVLPPRPSSPAAGQDVATQQILQHPADERLEDRPTDAESAPTTPEKPELKGREQTLIPLLHTMCHLTTFSILGTLTRLGLSALTTYPGTPLGGVIWAQFAGCVVMGFLIEDLRIFSLRPGHSPVTPRPKTTLPLYLGLTTGYCGSVTSFSSFLLVTFELLSNTVPAYTGRATEGYGVMAAIGYVIGTLALSFSGLQFGAQVALGAQRVLPSMSYRVSVVLDRAGVLVAVGMWGGAVAMAAVVEKWRGVALMACVFAPLGTMGRFWVGRWLNARVRTFPVGTFAVNVVGCAVLAGLAVGRYEGGGEAGCSVVRGWADGFCGCLTTVSTFVVEVRGLRRGCSFLGGGLDWADLVQRNMRMFMRVRALPLGFV